MTNNKRISVYVDESIIDQYAFICTAFIFSKQGLEYGVKEALSKAGLTPGKDEFKSGIFMAGKAALQELRATLLSLANSKARNAIVFTDAKGRNELGYELLHYLNLICIKNNIDTSKLDVYFDKGLFPSVEEAEGLVPHFSPLTKGKLLFEQNSVITFGIQVADAVAHSIGQILREELSGHSKTVYLGRDEGYEDGTPADLGWTLLMGLRYSLFTRPVVYQAHAMKLAPESDPLVVSDDDDIVQYALHPDLFGWGIFVSPKCDHSIQRAVRDRFDRLWLGCIH